MEIDPTTQKDSGFYECQANNQYAVDSRGFRTDYVMNYSPNCAMDFLNGNAKQCSNFILFFTGHAAMSENQVYSVSYRSNDES